VDGNDLDMYDVKVDADWVEHCTVMAVAMC